MSMDEILNWVDTWASTFGGYIDTITVSIGELVGEDSLWSAILPTSIKNTTIFGLMFTTAFLLFISITIWKWAKNTLL